MPGIDRITARHVARQESKPKKSRKFTSDGGIVLGNYVESALRKNLPFSFKSRGGYFAISSIGNGARQLCLSYQGFSEGDADLQAVRYMNNGTAGHTRWEGWLKRAKLLISSEQSVRLPELNIIGKYDFIIAHPTAKKILIELKTAGLKKVSFLKQPDDDHIAQWAAYSHLVQVSNGMIVYEERDSLTPIYFPLTLEDGDLTLYDINGRKISFHENYTKDLFDKVAFAIWCADNDSFPAEECGPCQKWGCKMPINCPKSVKEKKLVGFEEWRARPGTDVGL